MARVASFCLVGRGTGNGMGTMVASLLEATDVHSSAGDSVEGDWYRSTSPSMMTKGNAIMIQHSKYA